MGNLKSKHFEDGEDVTLNHFVLQNSVGRGSFGKVRIVEHKETKKQYALKYINKVECIRMNALKNVLRERNILEKLDHPFICNMRFAFQDECNMFMALDLMLGGDLRFHLNRRRFSEEAVRFWITELACGLRYLHKQSIIHRDIKPDNILLDQAGHAHLTDFNIAIAYTDKPLWSRSGTYNYMAPEIFSSQGYGTSVDWWSLGVVFYEAIYGKRPFIFDHADKVKEAIQHAEIQFPEASKTGPVSEECISAMKGFLERDVTQRLGCGPDGFLHIQQHPFFRDIDWDELEQKRSRPPFAPSQKQSNFDITYDLEELLLEQNPLETRPRKRNQKLRATLGKELERIEKEFRNFDYLLYERYPGYVDPLKMCVGDPPEWVKCVDPEPALSDTRGTKSLDGFDSDNEDFAPFYDIRRRTMDV
ncbi:kinase-like protein [Basidiobolus meristosporus CBS 931.73]|uniref:Kinase-like protein n=1 Tax=Basidiobolus meristosporus CBS 931.73 TaxID=1314790 RepID=A0A1Y1XVD4_9FUNG|nr:kinase-like protein [Basidiobolus meristosporus CBS 931.73]|eukprot:ORX89718.1 kinase-like protein [Basidiobolus meristosporus CBS 931.73]